MKRREIEARRQFKVFVESIETFCEHPIDITKNLFWIWVTFISIFVFIQNLMSRSYGPQVVHVTDFGKHWIRWTCGKYWTKIYQKAWRLSWIINLQVETVWFLSENQWMQHCEKHWKMLWIWIWCFSFFRFQSLEG